MRSIVRFSICLVLIGAAHAHAASGELRWAKSVEEAQQIAAQQGRLVLLHFTADDCQPCRSLEQNVFPRPEFQRAVATNYVPVMVNVNKNPQIKQHYRVTQWPTDVIITPAGEQLTAPSVSPQNPNQYIANLDHVAAQYRVQGTTRGSEQIARSGGIYPERGAAYAEPSVSAPPAAQPTQNWAGPQGAGYAPQTGAPGLGQAPTQPYAQAQQQPNAYGPQNLPPRQQAVDMTSSFQAAGPTNNAAPLESSAFVEGQAWRDPRATNLDPRQQQPMNSAVPPRDFNRSLPVGQGDAFAAPNRNVQLNTGASYGPQQPAVTQPQVDAQRGPVQPNPHLPAQSSLAGPKPATVVPPQANRPTLPLGSAPLALDGCCPVTLAEPFATGRMGKWARGDVRFGAVHRGRTYLFTNFADQQKFLADPDKFSPMLSGYDPVKYVEQGQLVDGKRQHGIVHQGHMYLFADEAALQRFCQQPAAYTASTRQAMQQSIVPTVRR